MIYLGNQAVGLATSLPVFSDVAKIECGIYTPNVDEFANVPIISHSLGAVPDFLLFSSSTIELLDSYTVPYLLYGSIVKYQIIQPETSTYGYTMKINYIKMEAAQIASSSGSLTIAATVPSLLNESTITFFGPTNGTLKANVPYYYILGKFKEQEVAAQ